jgi:phage antirepressor YoqD-like protein/phage regulator Rha-like protein
VNELLAVSHLTSSETLTMSSREIAEVVQSRHDSVKRAIETLADKGIINSPLPVEYSDHVGAGRPGTEYRLDKRSSIIVVAQLSPEFTAALVDRWAQLEAEAKGKPVLPDFNNPIIAARAWADEAEGRMLAETAVKHLGATVLEQAPKVKFAEAVAEAVNAQTVQEVAKVLSIGPNKLYKFLRDRGLLMHDNLPYQRYLNGGWFQVVERQWTDASGSHVYTKTLITGRGLQHIQRILDQEVA